MKSFKTYFTEASTTSYKNRFDLFNAVAGRIQLNKKAVQYMLPKEEKGKTFRHVTDMKGAEFLLTNKNKNVQISASQIAKICAGVETIGSVLISLTGKPVAWMPEDAFTFLGEGGIRWMDWTHFDGMHRILSRESKYQYFKPLAKILEKYPDMLEAMYGGGHFSAKELYDDQQDSLRTAYQSYGTYFNGSTGERVSDNLRTWMKDNKATANKILTEILNLQAQWLAGVESELKADLGKLYNDMLTVKKKNMVSVFQSMQGLNSYDEVVIDNVKIKNMYIKNSKHMMESMFRHIKGRPKEAEDKELKTFLNKIPNNIPFTFLDWDCGGQMWKDYLIFLKNNKSLDKLDEYLDWLGIKPYKRSKGIQWYINK